MNEDQTRKFEEHLQKLEATTVRLQQSVASIEAALAARGIYPAQAQAPMLPTPQPSIPFPPLAREEVFCVNCKGGNPPEAATCMWCGQPVRTLQIALPHELRVQAQAPATAYPAYPEGTSGAREAASAVDAQAPPARFPDPAPVQHLSFDFLSSTDFWLNKVGIGLLLLGVIFLFKYSVDQGWLTPMLRVATGLAIGTALAFSGLQLRRKRPALSQVLVGGSIAAYYSSGFAAFQLFHLVDYIPALAFMSAVTVFAFVYSLRQDNVLFSLIGVLGSLATPFLLRTEAPSLSGLVLYTCLIMAVTGAIYLFKGWRSLLWTGASGTLLVLGAGYGSIANASTLQPSDRWAFQAGLVAYLLAFWLLPVVRELLWTKDPARWPRPGVDKFALALGPGDAPLVENHPHYLILGVPFIVLFFSCNIWPEITNQTAGIIVLLASGVMFLAYMALRRLEAKLAYTHLMTALAMLTLGVFLIGDAQVLPLAFALEAAALHFAARRLGDKGISRTAHAVFLLSGLLLLGRLIGFYFQLPEGTTPLLNPNSLAALAVLVLAIGVSFIVSPRPAAGIYRVAAHLLFLLWLMRDLHGLPNGNGYVTISWGAYALALLWAGARPGKPALVLRMGLATLLLVVGKLFIVDLAAVETIWRIALFLGFGVVFLVLSYFFPGVIRGSKAAASPEPEAAGTEGSI